MELGNGKSGSFVLWPDKGVIWVKNISDENYISHNFDIKSKICKDCNLTLYNDRMASDDLSCVEYLLKQIIE